MPSLSPGFTVCFVLGSVAVCIYMDLQPRRWGALQQRPVSVQVEVDYQGGGSYKRKYRVREIIPRGAFDITFKNEQVIFASRRFLTHKTTDYCFSWSCFRDSVLCMLCRNRCSEDLFFDTPWSMHWLCLLPVSTDRSVLSSCPIKSILQTALSVTEDLMLRLGLS